MDDGRLGLMLGFIMGMFFCYICFPRFVPVPIVKYEICCSNTSEYFYTGKSSILDVGPLPWAQ